MGESCKLRGVDGVDIELESKQTVFALFTKLAWLGSSGGMIVSAPGKLNSYTVLRSGLGVSPLLTPPPDPG